MPGSDLSGQRLSEHLDGFPSWRVGHRPGAATRSPTDEPIMMMRPPLFICFKRRLRRDEHAADIDFEHRDPSLPGSFLERFGMVAGVVHPAHLSAEGRDRLFDRGLDCLGIGRRPLDRNRVSASAFISWTIDDAASAPLE